MNDFWTGILNDAKNLGNQYLQKEIDDNGDQQPAARPANNVASSQSAGFRIPGNWQIWTAGAALIGIVMLIRKKA